MPRSENDIRNVRRGDGNGEESQPPALGAQVLSGTEDSLRYRFPDSIRGSWDADGGVLLDLGRGQLIRVNPVAAMILKGIDRGESECEIAQGIAGKCEANLVTVVSDVHQFCELLEQQGLLTLDTTSPS
jgi:hypothetical protein